MPPAQPRGVTGARGNARAPIYANARSGQTAVRIEHTVAGHPPGGPAALGWAPNHLSNPSPKSGPQGATKPRPVRTAQSRKPAPPGALGCPRPFAIANGSPSPVPGPLGMHGQEQVGSGQIGSGRTWDATSACIIPCRTGVTLRAGLGPEQVFDIREGVTSPVVPSFFRD